MSEYVKIEELRDMVRVEEGRRERSDDKDLLCELIGGFPAQVAVA